MIGAGQNQTVTMSTPGNHQTRASQSREDRTRTLGSIHEVERLAGAPGLDRPDEWRDDLLIALDGLASSLYDQFDRSAGDDGLLGRLTVEAPNLTPSVTRLGRAQADLLVELDELRQSLSDLARSVEVGHVRRRVAELTRRIRDLRAWEVDLVYEAIGMDLGTGD